MVQEINKNQITGIFNETRKPLKLGVEGNTKADALLQTSYESVAEAVKQEPIEDTNRVERARQLLLSGELDSPENILKAAKNILEYGV